MIYIHCHILPAVVDGALNWETTLEMCRLALADGITHIVATPHANHRYVYDRERHQDILEELKVRVPNLRFSLGADFHLSESNIRDAIANPSRYTIGESPYVLVEFSDYQTPRQMLDQLSNLNSAGLQTIVTHPERNLVVAQYTDLPEQFVNSGSFLQITADSLTGAWGRGPRTMCESLLRKGLVSFIASDAHDTQNRRPILSKARKAASRVVGATVAAQLVEDNPLILLNSSLNSQVFA